MRRVLLVALLPFFAVSCGSHRSGGMASFSRLDEAAPAWVVRDLRHTYEPIQPCPSPCSRVLRESHWHVVRMHRQTMLALGTLPHPTVQARFPSGLVARWYLYRSAAGLLCDDVVVASGGRPVAGALTPGLPCVPGAPCGAICLMQVHCCGANVLVGTVSASADQLEAVYDDGTSTVRYRLDGPSVPGRPRRRFVALEIAPHDYSDPVRLLVGGTVVASGSVQGLG